ncbi:MAG: hypothetical protein ACRDRL_25030 [Sciscionella sp.]
MTKPKLRWGACARCESPVPVDEGGLCRLCGGQTGELWSADRAAGHCGIAATTWMTYRYERRIPPPLGYHPVAGVLVWDERGVREWDEGGRPPQSGPVGRRKTYRSSP